MTQPLRTVCYWCGLTAQRESSGMCIKTGARFWNHLQCTQRFGLYQRSYIINFIARCVFTAGLDLVAILDSIFVYTALTDRHTDRLTCHCTKVVDKLFYVERTVRRAKTYKTCPLWEQPIPLLQIKVGATNLLRQPLSFSHSLLWDWILFRSPNLSVVRSPVGDKDRKQGGLLATLLTKQDDRIAHFWTEKEKDTVTCY